MKILSEIKNSLLNRKELKIALESNASISFETAKNTISEKTKADKELIIIKKIDGSFGNSNFIVDALIYNSKEDKEHIEPKIKEKKK
jgi:ribosomal protein S24E